MVWRPFLFSSRREAISHGEDDSQFGGNILAQEFQMGNLASLHEKVAISRKQWIFWSRLFKLKRRQFNAWRRRETALEVRSDLQKKKEAGEDKLIRIHNYRKKKRKAELISRATLFPSDLVSVFENPTDVGYQAAFWIRNIYRHFISLRSEDFSEQCFERRSWSAQQNGGNVRGRGQQAEASLRKLFLYNIINNFLNLRKCVAKMEPLARRSEAKQNEILANRNSGVEGMHLRSSPEPLTLSEPNDLQLFQVLREITSEFTPTPLRTGSHHKNKLPQEEAEWNWKIRNIEVQIKFCKIKRKKVNQ